MKVKIYLQRNWVFEIKSNFFHPFIFTTQCRRPQIFQIRKSVRSNNLSLIRMQIKEHENLGLWQRLPTFYRNITEHFSCGNCFIFQVYMFFFPGSYLWKNNTFKEFHSYTNFMQIFIRIFMKLIIFRFVLIIGFFVEVNMII